MWKIIAHTFGIRGMSRFLYVFKTSMRTLPPSKNALLLCFPEAACSRRTSNQTSISSVVTHSVTILSRSFFVMCNVASVLSAAFFSELVISTVNLLNRFNFLWKPFLLLGDVTGKKEGSSSTFDISKQQACGQVKWYNCQHKNHEYHLNIQTVLPLDNRSRARVFGKHEVPQAPPEKVSY